MSDNHFKYLSEEFRRAFLELVKQKGVYPYEYMDRFIRFFENKLPDKSKLSSSLKDECISEKAADIWNVFKLNYDLLCDYYDI